MAWSEFLTKLRKVFNVTDASTPTDSGGAEASPVVPTDTASGTPDDTTEASPTEPTVDEPKPFEPAPLTAPEPRGNVHTVSDDNTTTVVEEDS